MRTLYYESKNMKIYKDGDAYEIFKISGRSLDGIYDVSMNYYATFAPNYSRDWLGRTSSWPSYNFNSDPNYAAEIINEYIEEDKKQ